MAWIDGYHLNTSFFRFVFKHLPQCTQPRVVRGTGQMPVLVHKGQGQIFDRDLIIIMDQPLGRLVKKIRSSVGDFIVQACDPVIVAHLFSCVYELILSLFG
jgi:hypothetical protein